MPAAAALASFSGLCFSASTGSLIAGDCAVHGVCAERAPARTLSLPGLPEIRNHAAHVANPAPTATPKNRQSTGFRPAIWVSLRADRPSFECCSLARRSVVNMEELTSKPVTRESKEMPNTCTGHEFAENKSDSTCSWRTRCHARQLCYSTLAGPNHAPDVH